MTRVYNPSVKTIKKHLTWLSDEQAKTVRGLIDGSLDPEETSEAVVTWVAQCYNYPDEVERIMCAIDDIMKTCGVEAIFDESGINVLATYCNTGESYAPTILYDYQTEKFRVMSWGDYSESQ